MKRSPSQEYVDDLARWQKNMYQPGAYTGGDFPMDIKYGGKKIGYVFLIQGIAILLVGMLSLYEGNYMHSGTILVAVGALNTYGGFAKIRRSKR
jgi:hypothetical protein